MDSMCSRSSPPIRCKKFRPATYGLNDVRMRATATDIAVHSLHHIRFSGIGLTIHQRDGREDHARGAECALKGAFVEKRLLHWMQLVVDAQPFDRRDILALDLGCGSQTTERAFAIDEHATGAAGA